MVLLYSTAGQHVLAILRSGLKSNDGLNDCLNLKSDDGVKLPAYFLGIEIDRFISVRAEPSGSSLFITTAWL